MPIAPNHPGARRLLGFVSHAAAIFIGIVLMGVAMGIGVTMVLLPLAFPLGFFGLGLFGWGLFEHKQHRA